MAQGRYPATTSRWCPRESSGQAGRYPHRPVLPTHRRRTRTTWRLGRQDTVLVIDSHDEPRQRLWLPVKSARPHSGRQLGGRTWFGLSASGSQAVRGNLGCGTKVAGAGAGSRVCVFRADKQSHSHERFPLRLGIGRGDRHGAERAVHDGAAPPPGWYWPGITLDQPRRPAGLCGFRSARPLLRSQGRHPRSGWPGRASRSTPRLGGRVHPRDSR